MKGIDGKLETTADYFLVLLLLLAPLPFGSVEPWAIHLWESLVFSMLLGRLEIFAIAVLFSIGFWRNR